MLLSRNCGRRGRQRKLRCAVAAAVLFKPPGFGGPHVDDRLAQLLRDVESLADVDPSAGSSATTSTLGSHMPLGHKSQWC